jgi:hypothetical protein
MSVLLDYVPGAVRLTGPAREQRTGTYRTWVGRDDMGWCAECLLCGEWSSSGPARGAAARWGAERHPHFCHAVNGCHCREPHITAAMGARLGLGAAYPRHLAGTLFRLAGGVRKYRPPAVDYWGVPHHGLMTYLEARISARQATGPERADYADLAPAHQAWLARHRAAVRAKTARPLAAGTPGLRARPGGTTSQTGARAGDRNHQRTPSGTTRAA